MDRELRKIWGDSAYQGADLKKIFFERGVSLDIVKRPSRSLRVYNASPDNWKAVVHKVPGKFTVIPKRWVVERTYAWMGRNRRLSKDYEYLPEVSESYLYIAMTKTMLGRLKFNF